MSGIEIFSLIAAIIGVTEATAKVYNEIKDLHGLPEAFEEVNRRFPVIIHTLEDAKSEVDKAKSDDDETKALQALLQNCKKKADEMLDIFETISKKKSSRRNVITVYRLIVVKFGKRHRVETLMNDILKDLGVLATHHLFQATTQRQVEPLLNARNGLAAVPPSLPDEDFDDDDDDNERSGSASQSGNRNRQYNSFGGIQKNVGGNYFKAKTQYIGCDINQFHVESSSKRDNSKFETTEEEKRCHQLFRLTDTSQPKAGVERKAGYEEYKSLIEDRVEGTCNWFLGQEKFEDWLKAYFSLLLVTGDPGCGKSVLSKFLIDHELPRQISVNGEDAVIGYFFFKDQIQSDIQHALCALLHQLFSQKPCLIRHAMKAKDENGAELINLPGKLWEILQKAVTDDEAGQVIFVLDALDECNETDRQHLVTMFKTHFQSNDKSRGRLKVLITSRPYGHIMSSLNDLIDSFPNMRIPGEDESSRISQEINAVIKYRIREFEKKRRRPEGSFQYLEKKLMQIEHRTYLWLHLVFGYLEKLVKLTEKEMDKRVFDNVPENFDEAYEAILEKSGDKEKAMKVFKILLAAFRPLTVAEMQIALEIDTTSRSLSDLDLEDIDQFVNTLRDYCGLFISIDNGMVFFLHQTAREFLLPKAQSNSSLNLNLDDTRFSHSISIETAHLLLGGCCSTYIKFTEWTPELIEISKFHWNNEAELFLDYAMTCWSLHIRHAGNIIDATTSHSCFETCNTKRSAILRWLNPILYRTILVNLKRSYDDWSALEIASCLGLINVVRLWLEKNRLETYPEDFHIYHFSLLWANMSGHYDVFRLLLETDQVDPNFKSDDEKEYEVALELLLSPGRLSPENYIKLPPKSLNGGLMKGNCAIFKVLFDTGELDVRSTNIYGETLLLQVAGNGDEAIVRLLLETGQIEINLQDKHGQTALMEAVMNEHEAIVRLLLETDQIEINLQDKHGQTALMKAVMKKHEAIIRLLLETGQIKINLQDGYGETALMMAARNGCGAIVKLLLEVNQADVDLQDNYDQTAVIKAAENGHEEVIELLLDTNQVNVNFKDRYGQTLLWLAAKNGCERVFKRLIKIGLVDVDSKDLRFESTPLLWAAAAGYEGIVRLLLETGRVNATSMDMFGRTPLSEASFNRHHTVVELLESYLDGRN